MFETFSRSWKITKLTFNLIFSDMRLLAFPILSSVFSSFVMLGLLVPYFLINLSSAIFESQIVTILMLFVTYLIISIIATFFNMCTVYSVKEKFNGRSVPISEAINFSFSKFMLIFLVVHQHGCLHIERPLKLNIGHFQDRLFFWKHIHGAKASYKYNLGPVV